MTDKLYHYTYLITNLNPIDDKKYYIGVRSANVIPLNDTLYMGSSVDLTKEILECEISQFEKIIISEWPNRQAAEKHEKLLHLSHDAANNQFFYNKKNGTVGFHVTLASINNLKETVNDPYYKGTKGAIAIRKQKETKANTNWKETTGKEQSRKLKETLNDSQWKETVGAVASKRQSNTLNDPQWKETVGQNKINKFLDSISDPLWLGTKGKMRQEKRAKTISNPNWKKTVLRDQKRKEKETKSSDHWINEHTVTCNYCKFTSINSGAFRRWHGENCRNKQL